MNHYPLTLRFPPGTSAGVPVGRWHRLPTGEIEATYSSQGELALGLEMARGLSGPEGLELPTDRRLPRLVGEDIYQETLL